MASSLPPPDDVRAFRAEVRRIIDDAGEALDEPGCPPNEFACALREELADACRDFDRAADLAALAPGPDREWQHGSCLSIAEGAPGWDRAFGPEASPAMLAVQKLRAECNDFAAARKKAP